MSFLAVYFLMPLFIRYLVRKEKIVQDYHKSTRPNVPRPAGPILLLGTAIGEIILYFLMPDLKILAILFTTIIAFIVGLIDDLRVMPGWFKPAALVAASIPIIVLGAHGNYLNLIFGDSYIPILYLALIVAIIPIAGNTINSIDVLNGVATGIIIISSVPLLISIAIFGDRETLLAGLPMFFSTIAFYRYHKIPSKIFPGDSGTLLLGAMYGALAIAGRSELIAVIALLPAVMNSFLFLSSVKKIVEHRDVKSRPTILTEDFKLVASKSKDAPSTLVRLIVAKVPLSEDQVIRRIFTLAVFSSILALVTIAIQFYFIKW
jgi:UDP-GlcNAc:undecaprenyl-phosphate/decaprenyl-phosphate GlcNAc-1-phosphate transferase